MKTTHILRQVPGNLRVLPINRLGYITAGYGHQQASHISCPPDYSAITMTQSLLCGDLALCHSHTAAWRKRSLLSSFIF